MKLIDSSANSAAARQLSEPYRLSGSQRRSESQRRSGPAGRCEPLRTSFIITSMPVGGAETLLVNLITRLDKRLIRPEVLCLKEAGPLGEQLREHVPVRDHFLRNKFDMRVLLRLYRHMRKSRTDAVITIGAGDKMFWGRLAARLAEVPVICSALHSTGWPDGVGKLNRQLTAITDAFIAVAQDHAQFLINWEGFPRERVFMIPNGVDTARFRPDPVHRAALRESLGLPADAPLVGIVAALREEKNHGQFVLAARDILRAHPDARFVIVGDGPMRDSIERQISDLGLQRFIHLLGTRSDIPDILAGLDVFTLTSKNEANPVSILEALSCGVPVVSPNVGSVRETVLDGKTGYLTKPGSPEATADAVIRLLSNRTLARALGRNGREHVKQSWSLTAMVTGYERLLTTIYNDKVSPGQRLGEFANEPGNSSKPGNELGELSGLGAVSTAAVSLLSLPAIGPSIEASVGPCVGAGLEPATQVAGDRLLRG